MSDSEDGGRQRFRQLPNGEKEFDDGVDRGDGRTRMGTFPKGRSGNVHGRPRGAINASKVVMQQLSRMVSMTNGDGSKESLSRYAASILKLTNVGLGSGNVRALERIIMLGLALEDKGDAVKPPLPLNDADRATLALIAQRIAERQNSAEEGNEKGRSE